MRNACTCTVLAEVSSIRINILVCDSNSVMLLDMHVHVCNILLCRLNKAGMKDVVDTNFCVKMEERPRSGKEGQSMT